MNDLVEEGSIVKLVDERNIFIAKGYYGKQNKGLGWVLSRKENVSFDQRFFENLLKEAIKQLGNYFIKVQIPLRFGCLMVRAMESVG